MYLGINDGRSIGMLWKHEYPTNPGGKMRFTKELLETNTTLRDMLDTLLTDGSVTLHRVIPIHVGPHGIEFDYVKKVYNKEWVK